MANYEKKHFDWLVTELEKELEPQKAFLDWLNRLHSRDADVRDGAWLGSSEIVNEFASELIICFKILSRKLWEQSENGKYGYNIFYGLIGEAVSYITLVKYRSEMISLFEHDLIIPVSDARYLPINSLGVIGKRSKEARKILWNARNYTFATEKETQNFRKMVENALSKAKE